MGAVISERFQRAHLHRFVLGAPIPQDPLQPKLSYWAEALRFLAPRADRIVDLLNFLVLICKS